jgi:hypothetical protein
VKNNRFLSTVNLGFGIMDNDKSVPNMSIGKNAKSSRDTANPNLDELQGIPQDDWEFELDLMGTTASTEALEGHLEKAPDPQSATAQFLKGYIASHAQATR